MRLLRQIAFIARAEGRFFVRFPKLLLATLPHIAPNLCVSNGLDTRYLSHDDAVAQAYRADRYCHDRVSGRLARFIADAGPATVPGALGDDPYGALLRRLWDEEGVDHRHVLTDPAAFSAIYFVTHDEGGHHFSFFRSGSTASRLAPATLPRAPIETAAQGS